MVTNAPRRNLLTRKLLRDIRINWKAFSSMLILSMLSVTLLLGISAGARGMDLGLSAQFSQSNLADLWIGGGISDSTARRVASLSGALDAQRRVRLRVKCDLSGDPKLDLYMYDGAARVSMPIILRGSALPDGEHNACVIDQKFAKARGIDVGDRLTVIADGVRRELRVTGICHSPEYVVHSDGYSFNVDPHTFGYGFVSSGTFADLPYNETVVKLAGGADANAMKQAVEALVEDDSIPVMTRDDKAYIKMAIEEADQVRAMGEVFPAVFFLVAALITFSTMRRMVENQRLQLGTLYSLGFGRGQLMWHYASFGLIIGGLGAVLGTLGAVYGLGRIVMEMLKSLYAMPGAAESLHPAMIAAAALLSVVISMGASYLSSHHALRESPASLLRPKPPKSGKRVLLEQIPFIWKRLSFSGKLIVRNLLRNPSRFLVGLIGVIGCATLLLTGFGMRDSVSYVLGHYFGYTMRYDVRVDLKGQIPDGYPEAIAGRAGAQHMERVMEGSIQLFVDGRWQRKQFTVLEDRHDSVYIERGGQRVYLPTEGVALTQRAAEDLGLKIGDTVRLRGENGYEADAKVNDIIDIQLGQGVYLSRSALRKLDIMPYMPTALYLSGDNIDAAAANDMDGVEKARTIQEERGGKTSITGVMDLLVLLMALFAGALLLVVMYTLGELNFFERTRDLATLMVLGFYPRETKRLILRENMIVAILGLPIGLMLGPTLHRWVLAAGLPSILQFVPYISLESWIYTSALTIAFACLVNRIMGTKFKSVNMVEALKSVE